MASDEENTRKKNNLTYTRNNLNSSVNSKNSAVEERRRIVAEIDARLERLRRAKNRLKAQYDAMNELKKSDLEKLNDKINWKGNLQSTYSGLGETLKNANKSYEDKIKAISGSFWTTGEIDKEISYWENEKFKNNNIITRLCDEITDLSNRIRRITNELNSL